MATLCGTERLTFGPFLPLMAPTRHGRAPGGGQNYTDPGTDPFPEIDVVWHRLDIEAEDITNDGLGTNGSTTNDGLFILAGLDPTNSGCWKVTATFGDASLSYVYEKVPG